MTPSNGKTTMTQQKTKIKVVWIVRKNGEEIGRYKTRKAAERAANWIEAEVTRYSKEWQE